MPNFGAGHGLAALQYQKWDISLCHHINLHSTHHRAVHTFTAPTKHPSLCIKRHMPAPAHSKLSQEQRIALAITDVRSGKCSGRAAAKLHSVPPSTLNDRLHGVPTRSESHSDQFRLSAAQEKVLVDWCHFLDLTAHPLNRQTIYPKVKALCGETPGHNWLDRFLQRHKLDLFTGKTAGLDPKRARAFNYATIQDYFQKLKAVIDEKKIPWHNIYNMDEKGIQLGGGRKNRGVKYILSRHIRSRYRTADSNLELVTVIECVSAAGEKLPPGFVLQGKRLLKRWFTEETKGAGW
jgi:hypothetical protein